MINVTEQVCKASCDKADKAKAKAETTRRIHENERRTPPAGCYSGKKGAGPDFSNLNS